MDQPTGKLCHLKSLFIAVFGWGSLERHGIMGNIYNMLTPNRPRAYFEMEELIVHTRIIRMRKIHTWANGKVGTIVADDNIDMNAA